MERAESLTGPSTFENPESDVRCARCGERSARMPSATVAALGGAPVRRCLRCGARTARRGETVTLVFSCRGCGVPFEADEILPHDRQRCEDCTEGRLPPESLDRPLAEAMEREVLASVAGSWSFLRSTPLSDYLDRVARQAAARIEDAPADVRVDVFDDPAVRSLALPSGRILVSVGWLAALRDEAELVFALAHEIAHAASRDAEARLVRLGYRAAVRERGDAPGLAWADAADDLVRLGYGRRRERDADARALAAALELRYDPSSTLRLLHRLEVRAERGEPEVDDWCVAHPPPADRIRRVERALYGRAAPPEPMRVNREVFRRVAGESARGALRPVSLDAGRPAGGRDRDALRRAVVRGLWIAGGVAALAAAILGIGLLLTR